MHACIWWIVMLFSAYVISMANGDIHKNSWHFRMRQDARAGHVKQLAARDRLNTLWDAYLQHHERELKVFEALKPGQWPPGGTTRLIVVNFRFNQGWGNRLPSTITAAVLALLTNRILLFKCQDVVEYADSSGNKQKADFDMTSYLQPLPQMIFKPIHEELLRNASVDFLGDGNGDRWPKLMLVNWNDTLNRNQGPTVIQYMSGDYEMPLLAANPQLAEFFQTYLPDGEIFHHFWQRLFKPSPEVSEALQRTMKKEMSGPELVVGLQIRTVKGTNSGFKGFSPDTFFIGARASANSRGYRDEQVKFFIAADKEEIYVQAAKELGANRVFWTDNGIAPRPEGLDPSLKWNERTSTTGLVNPGSELSGLVDLLLLAHCHDIVVSWSSSFGGLASGISNIKPIIVYPINPENFTITPHFLMVESFRALTAEPCFQNAGWAFNKYHFQSQAFDLPTLWKTFINHTVSVHQLFCHGGGYNWAEYGIPHTTREQLL